METSEVDLKAAHEHFSVHCYNRAWGLLDKPARTIEENEQMIRLSLASHWHWTQRDDCTPENVSAAYWQTSRIYAVLGQGKNARRYGQLCLEASRRDDVAPFYLAYAYEALARAELVAGNRDEMASFREEAYRIASTLPNQDAQAWLLDDLETIE